jgi:oligosaccharide repeat unit polymerase
MGRALTIKNSIVVQVLVIILQCVFFLLPLSVDFFKYDVIFLFVFTLCFSLFYVKVPLYHPYILFLCTFFLFLLSRVFLDIVGVGDFAKNDYFIYYTFPKHVQYKILELLILALSFIHLGTLFAFKKTHRYQNQNYLPTSIFTKNIKKITLIIFYSSLVPCLLYILIVISYVVKNGYISLYTSTGSIVTNPILKVGDDVCTCAFYLFLACFPNKKELKVPLIIFGGLLILSLGIGLRGMVFTQVFTLIAYLGFRNMINKKILGIIILGIIVLSQTIEQIRIRKDISSLRSQSIIEKFLHSQGTSVMVVGLSVQEKENLKDVSIFSPLLYMTHYSFIAKMLNLAPHKGQSKEFISVTRNLDATLAYKVNKTAYLNGNGMGTSMIAEFYVWGGGLGVIFGSCVCLYFIIYFFEKYKYSTSGMFILLYVFPSFFFWPRSHPLMVLDNIVRPLLFLVILQLSISGIYRRKRIIV